MKLKKLRGVASLLLAGALVFTSVSAPQTPSVVMAAEEGEILGTADRWQNVDSPTLRDYATPSVNYVGYGMGADNFADENMNSFWNAHGDTAIASRPQWMKYDFGERMATLSGMMTAAVCLHRRVSKQSIRMMLETGLKLPEKAHGRCREM